MAYKVNNKKRMSVTDVMERNIYKICYNKF